MFMTSQTSLWPLYQLPDICQSKAPAQLNKGRLHTPLKRKKGGKRKKMIQVEPSIIPFGYSHKKSKKLNVLGDSSRK